MANSGGGCFLPNENQTISGGLTFVDGATLTGVTVSGGTVASATLTSPTITGTTTIGSGATITAPALVAATFTGVVAGTTTITGTTQATTRYLHSAVVITPTSTFSVTGGGSIAGVRGEVTLTTAKSFTDGFLYGVQGKFTLNGTMAEVSAARIVGVLGQLDLASGTVTAGQASAIWADIQASSPTLTVPDQINVLRVTNSTSSTLNAMAFFYGQSTYFFTCGRDGGTPTYFGATAPTSLAKSLKIDVGGTTYYIGLYTAAS